MQMVYLKHFTSNFDGRCTGKLVKREVRMLLVISLSIVCVPVCYVYACIGHVLLVSENRRSPLVSSAPSLAMLPSFGLM